MCKIWFPGELTMRFSIKNMRFPIKHTRNRVLFGLVILFIIACFNQNLAGNIGCLIFFFWYFYIFGTFIYRKLRNPYYSPFSSTRQSNSHDNYQSFEDWYRNQLVDKMNTGETLEQRRRRWTDSDPYDPGSTAYWTIGDGSRSHDPLDSWKT